MNHIIIVGLMTALSYMICTLYTWIYAVMQGYVYFSAGEPNIHIRNLEWVGGIYTIFILIYLIKRELDHDAGALQT